MRWLVGRPHVMRGRYTSFMGVRVHLASLPSRFFAVTLDPSLQSWSKGTSWTSSRVRRVSCISRGPDASAASALSLLNFAWSTDAATSAAPAAGAAPGLAKTESSSAMDFPRRACSPAGAAAALRMLLPAAEVRGERVCVRGEGGCTGSDRVCVCVVQYNMQGCRWALARHRYPYEQRRCLLADWAVASGQRGC